MRIDGDEEGLRIWFVGKRERESRQEKREERKAH